MIRIFEQDFEAMLRQYENSINDKKQFAALIKDLFPQDAKNVNLILIAYNMGIAQDIQKASLINNTFAFRYVKQLMDNYGISRKNADWIVSIWCVCYGEKILGKRNEIEVQKANEGPSITEVKSDVQKLYGDNFTYSTPCNGCVGIQGFSGDETSTVILPNRYKNYDVNYIMPGAFSKTNIEEVVITEGYRKINAGVFTYCQKLHQIILPESVREIDDMAFAECSSLKTINLPIRLEQIGIRSFAYSGLKTIHFPDTVYSVGCYAFEGCSELDNITIPDNIKCITKAMFKDCSSLKKINLSERLKIIESEAFIGCSSLDFIEIPDSVKEIGENAFQGTDKQFIVQCSFGSYAEQYCRKNKIKYQLV